MMRVRLWLIALALTAGPIGAAGQVLEIGDGGQVTTYDRPAVFTSAGAVPIRPTRAPPRPRAVETPRAETLIALNEAARVSDISPDLIEAVAWQESRFHSQVVSRAGAVGEMQLMPANARALGVDPYDTRQNFRGGATYLGLLLRRYDGDLIRSLAAYNAGPRAVDRYGGIPPYRETQDYVAAIMNRLSGSAVCCSGGRGGLR